MAESKKLRENRKKYVSYTWDTFYSALGFMESLQDNDIIAYKKNIYRVNGNYDGRRKVNGFGFSDWGDRESLYITYYEDSWEDWDGTKRKIDIWEFLSKYKQKIVV